FVRLDPVVELSWTETGRVDLSIGPHFYEPSWESGLTDPVIEVPHCCVVLSDHVDAASSLEGLLQSGLRVATCRGKVAQRRLAMQSSPGLVLVSKACSTPA